MAHHCVSNPCWICYPEYAPKSLGNFAPYTHELSLPIKELLSKIFQDGLDEDSYYYHSQEDTVDELRKELSLLPVDSLAAKLINLILEDCLQKGSY